MDAKELPARPDAAQYRTQAKELAKAYAANDGVARNRFAESHPRADGRDPMTLADAQLVVAREHGFGSWPAFIHHLEGFGPEPSATSAFERAVDTIVTGDIAGLRRLLDDEPALTSARSERSHRATLLHYVSANGVEDFRQKTPPNIVDVAVLLLDRGSEVDAVADMYGGNATTIGLVASSHPPSQAGVAKALIELLVERGAGVDGVPGGWAPLMSALYNVGSNATTLADLGARIDNVVAAAAMGRLDRLAAFFDEQGRLRPGASRPTPGVPLGPEEQLDAAFILAARFGETQAGLYLLDRGARIDSQDSEGETALHWACNYAAVETVRALLARGAPTEVRNNYGGTVLGQTIWGALNTASQGHAAVVEELLQAGANVRAIRYPTGHSAIDAVLVRREDDSL